MNFFGWNFIMQQANDPKHTANATNDFITGKQWKILDRPTQSPDLNLTEHTFHKEAEGQNPQNKQQLKEAVVEDCKSITKEVCNSLVTSDIGVTSLMQGNIFNQMLSVI